MRGFVNFVDCHQLWPNERKLLSTLMKNLIWARWESMEVHESPRECMRVFKSSLTWEVSSTSSTVINLDRTRENSHQLSWKILARSKSMGIHESPTECMRVYKSWLTWGVSSTSSTVINPDRTRENSYRLSWKIWARLQSMGIHESPTECMRV